MNFEGLFVFVIILLGLILFSFLGNGREGLTNGDYNGSNKRNTNFSYTSEDSSSSSKKGSNKRGKSSESGRGAKTNYDNYNHYEGSSVPTKFYGPDGATIKLEKSNDKYSIIETTKDGVNTTYDIEETEEEETTTEGFVIYGNEAYVKKYIAPNGASATIVNTEHGLGIKITNADGNSRYYYETDIYTYNPDYVNYGNNPPGYDRPGSAGVYNQPGYNPPGTSYNNYGGNPPGYDRPGSAGVYNQPGYNPPGTSYNPPGYDRPGSAGVYNQPGYNPPGAGTDYSSSLPPGIPASQIPAGQEDLYILKSEVVPPVCPACPQATVSREEKCPPCAPCGRCPEPSFECKKVPNYTSGNDYLPVPVLNDFSTFGM